MAKAIDAPDKDLGKGMTSAADRAQKAFGLVRDTEALASQLPQMQQAATNVALGEMAQTGVDTTTNPLAKSAQMRQEAAKTAASSKMDTAAKGLELRGQAIKMAGEAATAEKDAYNTAYQAIVAEKKRLGGFGGWLTGDEKKQFRAFRDQQLAGLSQEQQNRLLAAVGSG
tara:strand:- start:70 stop:579 length:510 start_codon:yes stop_codon:yes gene_type:complete